jgi:hypothetical protein
LIHFVAHPPGADTRQAFVWATTHWYSWQQTIDLLFGSDAQEYETIAKAAPGFPDEALPSQHANRFVPHYLVGLVSDALHVQPADAGREPTQASLHPARGRELHRRQRRNVHDARGLLQLRERLALRERSVALPVVRFLALAPGRLADSVFIIGGACAAWAAAGEPVVARRRVGGGDASGAASRCSRSRCWRRSACSSRRLEAAPHGSAG